MIEATSHGAALNLLPFSPRSRAVPLLLAIVLACAGGVTAQPLTVTRAAGAHGGPASVDGIGTAAQLGSLSGAARDEAGNLYFSDTGNRTIRKMDPATGEVSTLAGLAGSAGLVDGTGGFARFNAPEGLAYYAGSLYVADFNNKRIRRVVVATGAVSTLAPTFGGRPWGVASDGAGKLFVTDHDLHTVHQVVIATGAMAAVAGISGECGSTDGTGPAARFCTPLGIVFDSVGTLWVANYSHHTIRRISLPSGDVTTPVGRPGVLGGTDGAGTVALFRNPLGLAADGDGIVYVADSGHTIRKIATSTSIVSTLAGTYGVAGRQDGTAAEARFYGPRGIAFDPAGRLLVAEWTNALVRQVELATQDVTTRAGRGAPGQPGAVDGPASLSRFNGPSALAVDPSGNLYVADTTNYTVRKVSVAGSVSTLAGVAGSSGMADGTGSAARFSNLAGIAVDAAGNVYVADTPSHRIRKVDSAGVVTTLAGTGGPGSADGTGTAASFNNPVGVALDGSGTLYVADFGNHTIRTIDVATGAVSTLAGVAGLPGSTDAVGAAARFNAPRGVAVDGSGSLFVADQTNRTVRRIVLSTGTVSTLAGAAGAVGSADGIGAAARFSSPAGVAADGAGNLFVSDAGNHSIRRVVVSTGEVTTPAGLSGSAGNLDGTGTAARFSSPGSLAVAPNGSLYVADAGNHAIRLAIPSLADVATIDSAVGFVGETRQLSSAPQTATAWTWDAIRREGASAAALSSTTERAPVFTPDVPGLYTFRLTATSAAGASLSTVTLTVYARPTATVGGGGAICLPQAATIQAALTGEPPWAVTWSDGVVQAGLTASPAVRTVSPAATTVYAVTAVSDARGNGTSSGEATVTVNGSVPSARIAAPGQVAPGSAGNTASVPDAGAGATYAWTIANGTITSGGGSPSITWTAGDAGFAVLSATVTGAGGCSAAERTSAWIGTGPAPSMLFTHLAGPEDAGYLDGTGAAARFRGPTGLVSDGAGGFLVADSQNHVIRRVDAATGAVTTFAGRAGVAGSADGALADATFNDPRGIAVDGAGVVYVAENLNRRIRRIEPSGAVTTLAGSGNSGSQDGVGAAASFSSPTDLVGDGEGNLFVADAGDCTIRKIVVATAQVSTLAGLAGSCGSADGSGTAARFSSPYGVSWDNGTLFVADRSNHAIRKVVTATGAVATLAGVAGSSGSGDGTTGARFNTPRDVVADGAGNVYVSDWGNQTIRKVVVATGFVTTLAGGAGIAGTSDGTGTAARFNGPFGIEWVDGELLVSDNGSSTLRTVGTATAAVATLAGRPSEGTPSGWVDATGPAARFSGPQGVAFDAAGNAYVADSENRRVRTIDPAGNVTTMAGSGAYGCADGPAPTAQFAHPTGVVLDGAGTVYVVDRSCHSIRRISGGAVSTLAGGGGGSFADGPGTAARFSGPTSLALDLSGNLYVADQYNNRIRKVDPAGNVTTIAGSGTYGSQDDVGTLAQFNSPWGVAVDADGNLFVSDYGNHTIRRIALASGDVTTLAGSAGASGNIDGTGAAARFNAPTGIVADCAGNVYVSGPDFNTVRRVVVSTRSVTTLGGLAGNAGNVDGVGTAARFRNPQGIAADATGKIAIADRNNNGIRLGRWTLEDAATIDVPSGVVGEVRQLDTAPRTATAWTWDLVRAQAGSTAALSSTTIPNPTFTPDVPGVFVFRLLATNGALRSVSTVSLAVYPRPTAVVSGGGDLCAPRSSTVRADLTGAPPWSLTWSDGLVQQGLTSSPVFREVSPAVTTTYSVAAVSDSKGPGDPSGGATVTYLGVLPEAAISAPTSVAPGTTGLVASVPDAGPGATYAWTLRNGSVTAGDGTREVVFAAGSPGWTGLSVTVSTTTGCSSNGLFYAWTGASPTTPVTFTHLAGNEGGAGSSDGPGTAARFSGPAGAATDEMGNLFVADQQNHLIRRVAFGTGSVTTIAGLAGVAGTADGVGSSARFNSPSGIAYDGAGFLYVADRGNHAIRKVAVMTGAVSTVAGLPGAYGSMDGIGTGARFFEPAGVALDGAAGLLVTDLGNYTLRKVILATSLVTTVAGYPGQSSVTNGVGGWARFASPFGITVDEGGIAWVSDSPSGWYQYYLRRIDLATAEVTTPRSGYGSLRGLASGEGGILYAAEDVQKRVLEFDTVAGTETVLAGSTAGSADGPGTLARFGGPNGLALDAAGGLYVTDAPNNTVRKVDLASADVTTVAGLPLQSGSGDGTGAAARFLWPSGVAADGAGNVFVADASNHTVRMIAPSGDVTTVAGTAGIAGSADGTGSAARFSSPAGIAVDGMGNVWVADTGNHVLRRIDGAGVVTTVAGAAGSIGSADGSGTAARFSSPRGLAVDPFGTLIVSDTGNNRIRKVSPDGVVTTLAGAGTGGAIDGPATQARFNVPAAIALGARGDVYVADRGNQTIRRVDGETGEVSTLAGLAGVAGSVDGTGSAARFREPAGLAMDGLGNLWVAEANGQTIRRIAVATGAVSTAGGLAQKPGSTDGPGPVARFNAPVGIAADFSGNLLIADSANHCIRKGWSTLADAAVIDASTGTPGQLRQLDTVPGTATAWLWEIVRAPGASAAQLSSATIRNPTFTADAVGYYLFRLTASDGFRTSVTNVALTVACGSPVTLAATNDGPACEGGTVQLSVGLLAGATYTWSGPNGFSSNESLPTLSPLTPAMAGTYDVTATAAGCHLGSGSTLVVVLPKPDAPVIAAPSQVSPGATFTASVPLHAGSTWAWTVLGGELLGGGGTAEVTVRASSTEAVTLKVTETNAASCSSAEATAVVAVTGTPGFGPTSFYTLPPCRVVNTRRADFPAGLGAPSIGSVGGEDRSLPLTSGSCGIPSTAVAVALNVTVADTLGAGYLTLYPGDGTPPATSTINFALGQVKANNVFLPLAADGSGTIKVKSGSTGALNLLIDVVGYFE